MNKRVLKRSMLLVEGQRNTNLAMIIPHRQTRPAHVYRPVGDDYCTGVHPLQFSAGDYYRARGMQLPAQAFLDVVVPVAAMPPPADILIIDYNRDQSARDLPLGARQLTGSFPH